MSASEVSQQANRSELDPRRLVAIAYLVFGIAAALFVHHALEPAFAAFGLRNPEVIEGLGWSVTTFIGVATSVGLAVWAWTSERIRTLSLEVAAELMHVTWPSWEETRVSTYAVVIASIVAAVVLFGIDTASYKLMVDWIPMVWRKL